MIADQFAPRLGHELAIPAFLSREPVKPAPEAPAKRRTLGWLWASLAFVVLSGMASLWSYQCGQVAGRLQLRHEAAYEAKACWTMIGLGFNKVAKTVRDHGGWVNDIECQALDRVAGTKRGEY